MRELSDVNEIAMATPPTKWEGFLDRMDEVARALNYRSRSSFQAALGFSNGYFRSMRKLNKEAEYRIKKRYPQINIEYLRTGEGVPFLSEEEKENVPVEANLVPLLPISAMGGSLTDFDPSVALTDCEMIISPIKDVSLAITVSGDSMSPEYPNGCTVLVQRINDKAFIEWGRTYVLDTENGTIVKNVYPDAEDKTRVVCRSVNPNYPEFSISRECIRGWYRVLLEMALK